MAANLGSGYISVIPKMQGNLSSLVGKACSSASVTGSKALTSGFSTASVMIGNVLATGLSKAVGAISSSIGSAITKIDTLERFPTVMQNMGFSAEQSAASIAKIQEHLKGMPISTTEAVNGVKQFTAINGDLEKSTQIWLALTDAFRVGGATAEESANGMSAMIRMYATGKVQTRAYANVLKVMGGTLQQVAEKLGYTSAAAGGDMVKALQDGKLSMQDFMNALIDLDENGGNGFESLAAKAKAMPLTMQESFKLVNMSITSGVSDAIKEIGSGTIVEIARTLGNTFKEIVTAVTPVIKVFADFVKSIQPAIPTIMKVVGVLITMRGALGIFKAAKGTIMPFFNIIKGGASLAAGALEKLVLKMTAKSLGEGFSTMKSVGSTIGETGRKAKEAADNTAKGAKTMSDAGNTVKDAGTSIEKGAKKGSSGFSKLAGSALQILAIGGMIALAGIGFKTMAEGAKLVGETGPTAAVALGLMGAAMIGTVAVFAALGPRLQGSALGIIAVGGAILLAAAGFTALGLAAAEVGKTGGPGIAALAIMSGVMIVLVPLFAALGPALNIAAPGMLAFGGAVLMAGTGMGVAAWGAGQFVRAIADLIRAVGEFAEKTGVLKDKSNEAKDAFDGLNKGAGHAFDGLGKAIEGVGSVVAGFGHAIEGVGFAALAWGLNSVADATGRIRENSWGAQDGINSIRGASDGAGGALNNLSGTAQSVCGTIHGAFDGLSNNIYGVSNQISGSLTNGFNAGKSGALQACWDLRNNAIGIIQGMGGDFYWAGRNAGDSWARGFKESGASNAVQNAKNQAQNGQPNQFQSADSSVVQPNNGLLESPMPMFADTLAASVSNDAKKAQAIEINLKQETKQEPQEREQMVFNFYDTQTSPDAIYQRFRQSNTYGLRRSYA